MSALKTGATELIDVTDANFAREVLQSPLPVLLGCWAPWSHPCRMMAPAIDELAGELAAAVTLAKLNIEENSHTADRLEIQRIPAFLLFRDGQVIGEMRGAAPPERIKEFVRRGLARPETA